MVNEERKENVETAKHESQRKHFFLVGYKEEKKSMSLLTPESTDAGVY